MSLYSKIYRVGPNYKPNLSMYDDNYVEQFTDDFGSCCEPEYESVFHNYHELDEFIKGYYKIDKDSKQFEFEITKDLNEELMAFSLENSNYQASALMLTCKAVFRALREGFKVYYYGEY